MIWWRKQVLGDFPINTKLSSLISTFASRKKAVLNNLKWRAAKAGIVRSRNSRLFIFACLIIVISFGATYSIEDSSGFTNSNIIIEEVSADPSLYNKILSWRLNFSGAFLFALGGADKASEMQGPIGGPGGDQENSELMLVGDSAVVSSASLPLNASMALASSPSTNSSIYTVKEGDTLSFIADKFGISLNTLLSANGLSPRSVLRAGDKLTILPTNGIYHAVSSGETISHIAQRYSVDAQEILRANNINSSGVIRVGQRLMIPGAKAAAAVPVASANVSSGVSSLVDISDYFILPIARGRRTQGLHQYNAVDLGGSEYCNTPIYAAASGTAITAKNTGWNGGYGKYIKIAHPNGTVTLYAHVSQVLVSEGQAVSQGDVIALMGSTGLSTGCHVHFEVRGVKNPFTR